MHVPHLTLKSPAIFLFTASISFGSALEFDFIIIGGGTSGLTVANRLSEVPSITVAVIEAGVEVYDNPNVTNVDGFTLALGTDIDWQYESTNQTYAEGQKIAYHAGKALGGTSTINGMTYVRAQKAQIDTWEQLGNPGWNWDSLFPYYLKSEGFVIPTAAQLSAGASYIPADHGEVGPLTVGYPYGLLNGSLHAQVEEAWGKLEMEKNEDVNGGDVRGFTVWPSTVNREENVREDAARAYYYPVQNRENLVVFLETTANKIVWKEGEKVIAGGVEVVLKNGTVAVLGARREVIVSAGSLRSPALLELSGIGNTAILESFGIQAVVHLPSVGENLQDQPNNAMEFSTNTTFNGTTGYVAYGSLSDFFTGTIPNFANISAWAAQISNTTNNAVDPSALETLYNIQLHLIEQGVPDAETILGTTPEFGLGPSPILASAFWLLMPFSRGSVHILSADPGVYPAINPNYFLVDWDLEVQVAVAKWTRKFWETQPMGRLAVEISPGFEVVPKNATNEEWGEWIKGTFSANSHPLGTATMMSRELGGVVDSELKVYGTANVRVVDASILPFQVSGHLTSTLYAVAEKASDLIKDDLGC